LDEEAGTLVFQKKKKEKKKEEPHEAPPATGNNVNIEAQF